MLHRPLHHSVVVSQLYTQSGGGSVWWSAASKTSCALSGLREGATWWAVHSVCERKLKTVFSLSVLACTHEEQASQLKCLQDEKWRGQTEILGFGQRHALCVLSKSATTGRGWDLGSEQYCALSLEICNWFWSQLWTQPLHHFHSFSNKCPGLCRSAHSVCEWKMKMVCAVLHTGGTSQPAEIPKDGKWTGQIWHELKCWGLARDVHCLHTANQPP